jgi:hypothetical protein
VSRARSARPWLSTFIIALNVGSGNWDCFELRLLAWRLREQAKILGADRQVAES